MGRVGREVVRRRRVDVEFEAKQMGCSLMRERSGLLRAVARYELWDMEFTKGVRIPTGSSLHSIFGKVAIYSFYIVYSKHIC